MTQTDAHRPNLMTRLASAMRGEVSATTVESYRRAGQAAYADVAAAEEVRHELATSGTDLWSTTKGQASQLLCTWNAFALQTLGDQFIEADYRHDPRTVGYLPPVTAEQTARFLGEVEQWSALARRAAADPNFDVARQVEVPVALPRWVEVEPCPVPHLEAMLAAARSMRDHTEAGLADFTRAGVPAGRERAASMLRGLIADADSAVSYAESMWAPGSTAAIHQRVEDSVRRGIGGYYQVGQLLAVPLLLDRPEVQVATVTGARLTLPGQPGFDPWGLTDPASRSAWQRDPSARRAIDSLWRLDPDPTATLTIQAQIDAAVEKGLLVAGVDSRGQRLGSFYCCPWAAIYLVRRPVTIDQQVLRAGEQFSFEVSAEELAEGGSFKRGLVRGPFHPTNQVDYCDPTSSD